MGAFLIDLNSLFLVQDPSNRARAILGDGAEVDELAAREDFAHEQCKEHSLQPGSHVRMLFLLQANLVVSVLHDLIVRKQP